ncbi:maleylacetoacetate isomerase [Caulobacter sp. 17J65-9]|uniref:maleylacetoacetate isomerase n=1 Tax=Caulobacter sp. 17J65-9 TaxID=2709382 RepID=UPI0013CCC702|nr:maleylacetoacetate isomerase [Caulobacter sp. 17J65-9]NEX92825.1 maleylacetoacetate isomerase [Caulobacter sp. 17J65-9]
MTPVLHNYWRSGTSYRTRIALNLKGVAYEQVGVDLRAGAQKSDTYLALNPQGLVPALEADGHVFTQSPAILEWIEERWPEPALLPKDPVGRADVRAMAAIVACDIHPLNNLRVLKSIKHDLGADEAQTKAWTARWIEAGFTALEALIARRGDGWSFGNAPTLADCHLIPQIYSARRFEVDLTPFPRILEIEARAAEHPAFQAAHPDRQPDAD